MSDLARTHSQRRWDALLEMGRRAAGTLPGTSGSHVVTNIMMDLTTFERWTKAYARDNAAIHHWPATPPTGTSPAPGTGTAGTGGAAADDPGRPDYRCETLDGRPVDAATAIADALVGHVRRVVIDERGVTINQSRKTRLFRGNAALAARMLATVCYWPGCWHPVTDCQIDHLLPAADHGGPTDQDNGGPCCGHHNRLKQQGYQVVRLPEGTIAVYRPDGKRVT